LEHNLALQKQEPKTRRYPFVIGFSGFTQPSDSTCADNAVYLALQNLFKSAVPTTRLKEFPKFAEKESI
jgi:hypothetical protein